MTGTVGQTGERAGGRGGRLGVMGGGSPEEGLGLVSHKGDRSREDLLAEEL